MPGAIRLAPTAARSQSNQRVAARAISESKNIQDEQLTVKSMNVKTKAILMQMFKILGWMAPILFAMLFFWAASSNSWLAVNILWLATGRAKWTAFAPFGIVLIALVMMTMWLRIPKLVLSIANSVVFSSLIGIYWAFGLWNFSIKQRDDAILLLSAGFVGYLIYRAIAKLIDNQQ